MTFFLRSWRERKKKKNWTDGRFSNHHFVLRTTKQRTKISPHTPTYSFLVSACTYYFYHFSCTSSDSIYTIDIPPRLRNLHNHFLCAIPFTLLLFIYLSRFLGEIREMWSDEFVGYTNRNFQ